MANANSIQKFSDIHNRHDLFTYIKNKDTNKDLVLSKKELGKEYAKLSPHDVRSSRDGLEIDELMSAYEDLTKRQIFYRKERTAYSGETVTRFSDGTFKISAGNGAGLNIVRNMKEARRSGHFEAGFCIRQAEDEQERYGEITKLIEKEPALKEIAGTYGKTAVAEAWYLFQRSQEMEPRCNHDRYQPQGDIIDKGFAYAGECFEELFYKSSDIENGKYVLATASRLAAGNLGAWFNIVERLAPLTYKLNGSQWPDLVPAVWALGNTGLTIDQAIDFIEEMADKYFSFDLKRLTLTITVLLGYKVSKENIPGLIKYWYEKDVGNYSDEITFYGVLNKFLKAGVELGVFSSFVEKVRFPANVISGIDLLLNLPEKEGESLESYEYAEYFIYLNGINTPEEGLLSWRCLRALEQAKNREEALNIAHLIWLTSRSADRPDLYEPILKVVSPDELKRLFAMGYDSWLGKEVAKDVFGKYLEDVLTGVEGAAQLRALLSTAVRNEIYGLDNDYYQPAGTMGSTHALLNLLQATTEAGAKLLLDQTQAASYEGAVRLALQEHPGYLLFVDKNRLPDGVYLELTRSLANKITSGVLTEDQLRELLQQPAVFFPLEVRNELKEQIQANYAKVWDTAFLNSSTDQEGYAAYKQLETVLDRGWVDLFYKKRTLFGEVLKGIFPGVDFPERFYSFAQFKELAYNTVTIDRLEDKRPTFLMIHPKTDWNNAFEVNNQLDELLLHGVYNVVYFEPESDTAFTEIIRKVAAKKKITILNVGGHGSIDRTTFNEKSFDESDTLDLGDEQEMKDAGLGQYLDENAIIIMESCSTGSGGREGENIANMMSRIFSGRRVFAPKYPTSVREYLYDESWSVIGVDYADGDAVRYVAKSSAK